ncbi:putative phosphatidate phosphatase [Musca autumnalis]|uniref:putative phosphatidate phosphatase n=1 Tax=Musca autumnalis TaxID=221902 RepID=UPI003CF52191
MKRLKSIARIVFDLLIFAGVCLCELGLRKWLKPHKRGFFCNDESLQYPFRESTITVPVMVAIVLAVPCSVIMVIELFKQLSPLPSTSSCEKRKSPQSNSKQSSSSGGGGCRFAERLMHCYAQIGYYLFGLALTLVATHITKKTVGRLRPHFFAVCQPQMPDGSTCKDSFNYGRYIEDYTCLGQNYTESQLNQVGQSFPSAHSSVFFYAMLYLAFYLQATLSTRASKLMKHLLQFTFIMFAWYVALSRISDYWHHWSDVLGGIVLGCVIAFIISNYVAHIFVRRPMRLNSNVAPKPPAKPSASPANSSGKANSSPPVLPAYTFGTLPYLPHPHATAAAVAAAAAQQQAQYAQTYHNYGYVP